MNDPSDFMIVMPEAAAVQTGTEVILTVDAVDEDAVNEDGQDKFGQSSLVYATLSLRRLRKRKHFFLASSSSGLNSVPPFPA